MTSTESNPYLISRNKRLSRDDIRENIRSFARSIVDNTYCVNVVSRRGTSCQCLQRISSDDDLFEKLVGLLSTYKRMESKQRQLFVHGILTHGFIAKDSLARGSKSEPTFLLNGISNIEIELYKVCQNALKNLFGIGQRQWYKLKSDAALPSKDNSNYKNNVNKQSKCTQSLVDFLYEIGETEGESYATRFIRMETKVGIRDDDTKIIQLPSYFSKRSLYERYCYENGWIARSRNDGSYPSVKDYPRRENDDHDEELAQWPSGSIANSICSWSTFLKIWDSYLPFIKIRPPSLDTCLTCHVFRNRTKYADIKAASEDDASYPKKPLVCPVTNEKSLMSKIPADETEEDRENIILLAAKHVKAAQAQKKLARSKIELAKRNTAEYTTLVVDYCQNLDLPHTGGEQPGDTYYYSPIWLFCLGIANVADDMLNAYIYEERSGRKGANNVASMLVHYLKTNVLSKHQLDHHNIPKEELNLIMDNCGGQNKNGVIIKLGAYMVEKGWFKRVNLVFLIKGHTKNTCDRMFNLLKKRWHHSNVFSFEQSLDILNSMDQVNAIDASELHFDYNELLSKFYRQPVSGSINKNHIFQFCRDSLHNSLLTTKRSDNVVISSTQPLRYDPRMRKSCYRKLCLIYAQPNKLDGPGLKPIKHLHLYTKWRKILPQEYKDVTCPLPSNEQIMMAKKINQEK